MAEIIPFRGILYDRRRVSGEDVTAPPYDLITPRMREELYAKSPYNIVRVDFGMELPGDGDAENKYARAAGFLDRWLRQGVLMRGERPAFYPYRMEYSLEGEKASISGFFGLVRLAELGDGIYPHEATHSKPKSDRLSLMKATGANTSPIFALYSGAESGAVATAIGEAMAGAPYLSARQADGTLHSVWKMEESGALGAISGAMAGASIFIADGHHRYETALEYQKEAGAAAKGGAGGGPCDYVLMFLADLADEGIRVLPTHRVVTVDAGDMMRRLSGHFDVYELPPDTDIIGEIKGKRYAFGLYAGGRRSVLVYRGGDLEDVEPALRGLDVVVLHKLVFGRLIEVGGWGYEMDCEKAMGMVDDGEFDAAFFLNPTPVGDVERVSLAGLRMPPKSTYFFPKVRTGFVINSNKSF